MSVQALYVHTAKGVLIRVNPRVRLPRTFRRFCGLMVQLLQRLAIRASAGPDKLLKVNLLGEAIPAVATVKCSHRAGNGVRAATGHQRPSDETSSSGQHTYRAVPQRAGRDAAQDIRGGAACRRCACGIQRRSDGSRQNRLFLCRSMDINIGVPTQRGMLPRQDHERLGMEVGHCLSTASRRHTGGFGYCDFVHTCHRLTEYYEEAHRVDLQPTPSVSMPCG